MMQKMQVVDVGVKTEHRVGRASCNVCRMTTGGDSCRELGLVDSAPNALGNLGREKLETRVV